MAQNVLSNAPFEREWKTIDEFIEQGQPQSAKEAIGKLRAQWATAAATEHTAHRTKALLYDLALDAQLNEAGEWRTIVEMEAALAKAQSPQQALIATYLAEAYTAYYQANQWTLRDRTATPGASPTADETTWTAGDFLRRIVELHFVALSDESLRDVAFAQISPLVISEATTYVARPSVYDLLLHRALDYFSANDAFVGQPQYETDLDDLDLLAPIDAFVVQDLTTDDRSSSTRTLLTLLQRELRWGLQHRAGQMGLFALDLQRLQMGYRYLQHTDKDAAYEKALAQLGIQWKNTPAEPQILLEQARYHQQRGYTYDAEGNPDESLQWAFRTAYQLAQGIVDKFPETPAAQDARAMMADLTRPDMTVTMEAVLLPDAAGLVHVRYNNVAQVYFRIVALDEKIGRAGLDNDEIKKLVRQKPLQSWTAALPQLGDYRAHTTETACKGLKRGSYALIAASDASFDDSKGGLTAVAFWVSELALLVDAPSYTPERLMVVNRRDGSPIPNVTVNLWGGNERWSNNRDRIIGSYTTDANGQVRDIQQDEQRYVSVELKTTKDHLFHSDSQILVGDFYGQAAESPSYVHFFLDRGLYRPGQPLYFKALALRNDAQSVPQMVPNQTFTVTLRDANGQKAGELEVRTNAYGSAQGQFTLPTGGLLGTMSLSASLAGSSVSFSVEEYKRPRFEVTFDELEGTPALGTEVSVVGQALAYSGASIGGAKVVYTVVRRVRYPWYRWGRFAPQRNNDQTIATGEATTDAEGKFQIAFSAMPDGALGSNKLAQYEFAVHADVVDETGETRSGDKSIRLAKYPFVLDAQVPESHDRSQPLQVQVACRNLDAQPVGQAATWTLEQLDAPEQTQISRYWGMPDQVTMKESAFRKQFPLLPYGEKELPENWPVRRTLQTENVQLAGTDTLNINTQNLPVGHYQLRVFVITEEGDTLSVVRRLAVHDWSAGQFAAGEWLYPRPMAAAFQPGDVVKIQWGTTAPVRHYGELSSRTGTLQEGWLAQGSLTHTVAETDRGGLLWQDGYVLHNRFYSNQVFVPVPWDNKKLTVTYETFQSKLYPDADTEWIIRIDGPDKSRVAAEVLASMYDESLDQILPFSWNFPGYPDYYANTAWQPNGFNSQQGWAYFPEIPMPEGVNTPTPPMLLPMPGAYAMGGRYRSRMMMKSEGMMMDMAAPASVVAGAMPPPPPAPYALAVESDAAVSLEVGGGMESPLAGPPPTKVRTNLAETAFFFPQMQTDAEGRLVLKFKAPESLTRWKLQLFGHTTDLQYVLDSKTVTTQKELMVLPNAPRFLREGDRIQFTAKVSNLSDKSLSGQAVLELFDVETGAALAYSAKAITTDFTLAPAASQAVVWQIDVPAAAAGVMGYRVIARAGAFSDGEEAAIPVLTNRVLLTEAKPLFVRSGSTATFELANLKKAKPGTDHQLLRLDITSNPAWEAVKALPYLQEYPYDCTEQMVNRYFANAVATALVGRYPRIQTVFEAWRQSGEALKSPLLQNTELQAALIAETPWVMDAKDETLQRQRIALLFDLDKMATEQAVTFKKLRERQSASGAFAWFPGGRDSWYVTQYVAEQLSNLTQLTGAQTTFDTEQIISKAARYCDAEAFRQYEEMQKQKSVDMAAQVPSPLIAHYLYMRSMTPNAAVAANHATMQTYWWAQADKHWLKTSLHTQGLLALAAKQSGRDGLATKIYTSLRERALQSEELGMYWKYENGWYWHQLPIETHVLLLNLFDKMGADETTLANLKIWLLRNKETNRWETTKATAAAVHALLQTGADWLGETAPLEVTFPKRADADYRPRLQAAQANAEPGTGTYQVRWTAAEVTPDMATVRLKNTSKVPGWGAMYWQYFQTIDQVQAATDNPLRIERQLWVKTNAGQGDVLQPLTTAPRVGDRLTVRLVVRTDRDMEFVHLKDLRASGLEPLAQLSGYRYQSGLGYYQQTTDLGTHFFFDYLPKGEYVLEYDLRVFHAGDFSGGLATLQCMYAPKFTSHSEGLRLKSER